MQALTISGLTKTYRGSVHALKGVELSVQEGDFFALLGPNGAGKSTTIGIISSLVNQTSGDVKVFGYDLDKQKDQIEKLEEQLKEALETKERAISRAQKTNLVMYM